MTSPTTATTVTFVPQTHQTALGLLSTFDSDKQVFVDKPQITHTEETLIKTQNKVGAAFFTAAAAAFAYKKYHLIALGFGGLAIVALFFGRVTKLNPTDEFKGFTNKYDLIPSHFTKASVSKGTVMADQFNDEDSNLKLQDDPELSLAYENEYNSWIKTSIITDDQKAWRAVHKELLEGAAKINVDKVQNGSPLLNEFLEKISTAIDFFRFGRSPAPTEAVNKTYLVYSAPSSDGKQIAAMRPTPKVLEDYLKV